MKTKLKLISLLLFMSSSFFMFAQEIKKEKNTKSDPTVPIFEIKNDLGQTVFAVYPGGVKIFVDDETTKATGGGFTVGRIGTEKATESDILSVSPGNVNIYLDDETTKATGGGFTVGRIGTEKADGTMENFLTVTPDSTRVYIDENSDAGFAVGQIGSVGLQNFLHLTPENYFIGHQSGERTTGLYNLFLGYQSGFVNGSGTSNTFLGYQTGYSNTEGNKNVFIGDNSGYSNTTGDYNTFIGTSSGLKNTEGNYSTFLGYQAGKEVNTIGFNTCIGYNSGANGQTGNNRAFLGYSSGATSTGDDNTYLGAEAGYYSDAGESNVYIGTAAGRVATGSNNILIGKYTGYEAKGSRNILIGPGAGWNLKRSNILIIENTSDTLTPLIYGEFDNNILTFNAKVSVSKNLGINREAYANAALGINPDSQGYGLYVDAGSTNYAGYFNGDLYVTGDVTSASDIRFKKNIVEINNALEKVLNLRGVYYNWKVNEFEDKGFTKDKQIGVIAQEVEKVFPELVITNSDGYKAVDYVKFTPILIEAVKQQQKIIEKLENKIAELEKSNETLKADISEIQNIKAELNELKSLIKNTTDYKIEKVTETAK